MEKYMKSKIEHQKFGRLLVLRKSLRGEKYECFCDCGNIVHISKSSLIRGNSKSCGCLANEMSRNRVKIKKQDFPKIVYDYISSESNTLDDIGRKYKVSRERIRQILSLFGNIHKYKQPINPNLPSKSIHKTNIKIRDFWMKVDVRCSRDCWNWTGYINKITGRGTCNRLLGGKGNASRTAWVLTYGKIENSLWVLHACDNPACCNPNHLYLGTPKDNAEDRESRNRYKFTRGTNHDYQEYHILEGNIFKEYLQGEDINTLSDRYKSSKARIYKSILYVSKLNENTKSLYEKFKKKESISEKDMSLIPTNTLKQDEYPKTPYIKRPYWKAYSSEIAKRDGGYFCKYCGVPLKRRAESLNGVWGTIDHIRPKIRGGSDSLSNMVLSCNKCNSKKSAKILPILSEKMQF